MSRELLKQCAAYLTDASEFTREQRLELLHKINACLDEPEAEPVGYVNPEHLQNDSCRLWKVPGCNGINKPLWDHPPRQPVQLSDDEIAQAQINHAKTIEPNYEPIDLTDEEKSFWVANGRAVIAAYEEKQK